MRKKIILFFIITIIFSLGMLTFSFITVTNYQNIYRSKKTLKYYNDIISIYIDKNNDLEDTVDYLKKVNKKDSNIKIILKNSSGEVVYSNLKDFNNKNIVYDSMLLSNKYTLKTGVRIDKIKIYNFERIEIYIITLAIIIIITIIISRKLTKIILTPLKELEFITFKISKGELDKRAKITSKDELGSLGKTFNNMADQLQNTMDMLLDRQNKLSAILRSMDSGVIAIDRLDNIIMINDYVKNIFNIKDDIIGKNIYQVMPNLDFNSIFNDLEPCKKINLNNNETRDFRIKTTDIINQGQLIGSVAVLQDITDIKKLENMRSQFVANVSHELKTPLTSIKGFSETLKYVNDNEHKIKFLNIIEEETDRLTRLIDDILILSDLEQNKNFKREIFNPNEIIDNVFTLIDIEAKGKNVTLIRELKSTGYLVGDKDMFKQMILNLMDNAIKYSKDDAIVVVSTNDYKNMIEIIIKDNGIGIPKDEIVRVFERFYRVDKARSRAKGGTGLGLAIVKHIVKRFNGSINIESTLEKGSTFKIRIKYFK